MNDSSRTTTTDGSQPSIGEVTRTTRRDVFITSSSTSATPRSTSWTRTSRITTSPMPSTDHPIPNGKLDHTKRSVSVCCTKKKTAEKKEEEQREMARQAFEAWLSRKAAEPRRTRASPSRDEIAKHLRDDAKHRVYNTWYYKMFDKRPRDPQLQQSEEA